jgi:hypothetical protein
MGSWLKRLFGITPELAERCRAVEERASANAGLLPYMVNRNVLILVPGERFFRWKAAWDAHQKTAPAETAPDRWRHSRAYLVDCVDDAEQLASLVEVHRRYFINSYVEAHAPKSLWPWVPADDEFPEWFDAHLVSGTWDLSNGPLLRERDLLTAACSELGAL